MMVKNFVKTNSRNVYLALASLLIITAVAFTYYLNLDYVVVIKGQKVAKIESKSVLNEALDEVKKQKEANLGISINKISSNIELSTKDKLPSEALDDPKQLAAIIEPLIEYEVNSYAIEIDGEDRVFLKTEADANQVLENIKSSYVAEDEKVVDLELEEAVKVKEVVATTENIMPLVEAQEYIVTGTDKVETYKVKSGDSLWTIAHNNGLTVSELREANPQLKSDLLSINQELKLVKLEPLLHVLMTKELTQEEKIPYKTKYISTETLWRGQSKVKKSGSKGLKEVTYKIVSRNGMELERETLETKVLEEPSTQEVYKGTKRMVASRGGGDGQLAWPLRGTITSRFGPRRIGYHRGIDIDGDTGDPVYSAGNGKVLFAGWSTGNGYGNMVLIDHGDGLTTRYAHMSKIYTSIGKTVKRGDVIGAVGNTGRSYGSHLHFETMVNKKPINPIRYLGK